MSLRSTTALRATLGAAGLVLALIVAASAGAATFTGTVTDGTNPLPGICVAAFSANATDGLIPPTPQSIAQTGADAKYTLNTPTAISFKVGFSDCNPQPAYANQFADNSPDLDGAKPVSGFGS